MVKSNFIFIFVSSCSKLHLIFFNKCLLIELFHFVPINFKWFLISLTVLCRNKWFPSHFFKIFFLISWLVNVLNFLDFGEIYWSPWSNPTLSLYFLNELLPHNLLLYHKLQRNIFYLISLLSLIQKFLILWCKNQAWFVTWLINKDTQVP